MNWRKYPDYPMPEDITLVVATDTENPMRTGCYLKREEHQKRDGLEDAVFYDEIDDYIIYLSFVKYWIPLEELQATLPKDENKHPLEVIRDMDISWPRKYLTKQETLDLIPDKDKE